MMVDSLVMVPKLDGSVEKYITPCARIAKDLVIKGITDETLERNNLQLLSSHNGLNSYSLVGKTKNVKDFDDLLGEQEIDSFMMNFPGLDSSAILNEHFVLGSLKYRSTPGDIYLVSTEGGQLLFSLAKSVKKSTAAIEILNTYRSNMRKDVNPVFTGVCNNSGLNEIMEKGTEGDLEVSFLGGCSFPYHALAKGSSIFYDKNLRDFEIIKNND